MCSRRDAMKRKVIVVLLTLSLCLICLAVSADTHLTGSNPVDLAITGPTGSTIAQAGMPLLKADDETTEETTVEPTMEPVTYPTEEPTLAPTTEETYEPTMEPVTYPTGEPTLAPTTEETTEPMPGPLAPVADFTASPTSGSGPLTVRFTDTSLNAPTMWYWDFGDGGTDSSTGAPSHTYADPGTYTVTLTSSNMYGADTTTKTGYVTVNGQVMNNGAIYAQAVPAGATIFVNGNSYGASPVTIPDLFPGTYSVMATLNGYYADQQTVTVNPGRTTGYYPSLRSSPNPPVITGAISAQSSPSGATIYINGVNYGNTPFTVHNLIPAAYSVMATLNGYVTSTQVITVSPGQTSVYYPTLQPSPYPVTTGMVFARSDPDGAAIYLNGNYDGVSPVTIPDLAPGTYSMKATLNGYAPDSQRITISPGHVSFYSPVFYPSPQPIGSGQGIIAVYSNVDGAQVYFDNSHEGSIANGVLYVTVSTMGTPFQTYRVESPGYTPLTGTITPWPASGGIVKIQAPLVPSTVPTAPVPTTRTPLPIAVTLGALTSAGIILILAGNRKKAR
jgi:PKD repeat protein